MTHPLFGPEVREALVEDNGPLLAEYCEALHPATMAETLAGAFSVADTWKILRRTDVAHQADIFEYLPLDLQVQMVDGAGRPEMARLLEEMSSDDRSDLLRRLKPQVAENILRLVDEVDRRDIASLAKYPAGTAGALMTTDYAWLPDHITAGEALERLRLQAPDKETIYYVYVVDEQRRLEGVLSLRDLIMKPRTALVKDFMSARLVSVKTTDDQAKVAAEIARYDLIAIPVVDDAGKFVGIVTHDDVIDVVVQEATEDVLRMGAVEPGALDEPYMSTPYLLLVRKRASWLIVLFLGEMLTATAMGHFSDQIEKAVVLAMFIPLIISSGGNSGSQATTLIIRALALQELRLIDWWRVVYREIVSGLMLGAILGIIGFVRIAVWQYTNWWTNGKLGTDYTEDGKRDWQMVGLTVSLSLVGIVMWGTLSGSMLPFILKRVGLDPATSSAPFVATLVDVTGLVIYFTVASIILGL